MSKVIDITKHLFSKKNNEKVATDIEKLQREYTSSKGEDFGDRMSRIKRSLEKIDRLMVELKNKGGQDESHNFKHDNRSRYDGLLDD